MPKRAKTCPKRLVRATAATMKLTFIINFAPVGKTGRESTKSNKRSKDLGALLDTCSWDDIGNFLQIYIKNSLLQTKSIEIWVNSHTVPHYACINLRSYSTP